jgi:hypothetical protein
LIAGEALIGILLAIPFALLKDNTYFYIIEDPDQTGIALVGIALTAFVCYMLYRSVEPKGTNQV